MDGNELFGQDRTVVRAGRYTAAAAISSPSRRVPVACEIERCAAGPVSELHRSDYVERSHRDDVRHPRNARRRLALSPFDECNELDRRDRCRRRAGAPCGPPAPTSHQPTVRSVLRDCVADGRIDGHYSTALLKRAIRSQPVRRFTLREVAKRGIEARRVLASDQRWSSTPFAVQSRSTARRPPRPGTRPSPPRRESSSGSWCSSGSSGNDSCPQAARVVVTSVLPLPFSCVC